MTYYLLPLEQDKSIAVSIYSHRLFLLFISIFSQSLLLSSVWLLISLPTVFFLLFTALLLVSYRLKIQYQWLQNIGDHLFLKAAWYQGLTPVDPTFVERSRIFVSNTSRQILSQWGVNVSGIDSQLENFFQKAQEFGGTISLPRHIDVALGMGSKSSEIARVMIATFETTRVIWSRYSANSLRRLNEQGSWPLMVQETAEQTGRIYAQMSSEESVKFANDYTQLNSRDLQVMIESRDGSANTVHETHIHGGVEIVHSGSGDLNAVQNMLEPIVRNDNNSGIELKTEVQRITHVHIVQIASIILNTLFLGIWMLFQWGIVALGHQLQFDGMDLLIFNIFQVASGFTTLFLVIMNYYADIRIMYLRQKARVLQERKNSVEE